MLLLWQLYLLAIFLINLGWSISKDIDPVNSK